MIRGAFGIGLVCLAGLALAQERSFLGSYHPDPGAARLPSAACEARENANDRRVIACRSARVVWQGALDFTVSDPDRTVTLEANGRRWPVKLDTMPMYLDSVLEGDWNGDKRPDLAIKLAWGGNGVIGDMAVVVFALSGAAGGYALRAINSLTFDRDALVILNGKPTVLHVALVAANGTDGRAHNYFVYTPLEVRGTALVASARRTWVQYTLKPNSSPARNLTEAEKARAWAAAKPELFVPLR